jgi:hypothetical protein
VVRLTDQVPRPGLNPPAGALVAGPLRTFGKESNIMNARPLIQADGIVVNLRARPKGMTADEAALALVGVADGNRVRANLNWLITEGRVTRDDSVRPYRYFAAAV